MLYLDKGKKYLNQEFISEGSRVTSKKIINAMRVVIAAITKSNCTKICLHFINHLIDLECRWCGLGDSIYNKFFKGVVIV